MMLNGSLYRGTYPDYPERRFPSMKSSYNRTTVSKRNHLKSIGLDVIHCIVVRYFRAQQGSNLRPTA